MQKLSRKETALVDNSMSAGVRKKVCHGELVEPSNIQAQKSSTGSD
jgi:hypothetical protein